MKNLAEEALPEAGSTLRGLRFEAGDRVKSGFLALGSEEGHKADGCRRLALHQASVSFMEEIDIRPVVANLNT